MKDSIINNLMIFEKYVMERVYCVKLDQYGVKREGSETTLSMYICRDDSDMEAHITDPTSLYVSPDCLIRPENLDNFRVVSRYIDNFKLSCYKDMMGLMNSSKKVGVMGLRYKIVKMTPELYASLLDLRIYEKDGVKHIMFRFEPTKEEKELMDSGGYKIESPMSNCEFTDMYFERINRIFSLTQLVKEELTKKSKWVVRPQYDIDSLTISSLSDSFNSYKNNKGDTKEFFENFRYFRHEVFSKLACETLGIQFNGTDVDIQTLFQYKGPGCEKTPDMVMETATDIEIFDFAVTDASATSIHESKVKKYSELADGLSEATQKEVTIRIFVLATQDPDESIFEGTDETTRQTLLAVTQDVVKISREVIDHLRNSGALSKVNLTLKEEGTENEMKINEFMKEINDMLLAIAPICKLKAVKLSVMYDKEHSFIPTDGDMVYNEDDELVEEIKQEVRNFDYDKSIKLITSDLTNAYNNGDLSKTMNDMFNGTTAELLKHMEDRIRDQYLKGKELRAKVRKMPKLFKYPMIPVGEDSDLECDPPFAFNLINVLDDGTIVMRLLDEVPESSHNDLREGYGITMLDMHTCQESMKSMKTPSSLKFREMMFEMYSENEFIIELCEYKFMEHAWMISQICTNLAYLEGRRFVDKTSKRKASVCKRFRDLGIWITILAGSKLTKEKQIRYAISYCLKETLFMYDSHSAKCSQGEFGTTSWLGISASDIRHGCMMFNKIIGMISLYKDCYEEAYGTGSFRRNGIVEKDMILAPVMAMLVHKKGVSTSLQANRYIFHSMTSFVSNKKSLFNSLMDNPIRSVMDSYIRQMQMMWCINLIKDCPRMWDNHMNSYTSEEANYDKLESFNIFSPNEKVEFSWMMNDMYLGNLFEKASGFQGHKGKAIMAKMTKEELHLDDIKKQRKRETLGFVNRMKMIMMEDEHHVFDKDFVMCMGYLANNKMKKDSKYHDMIHETLMATTKEMMMMTSSLEKGPLTTPEFEFNEKILKDFSMNTILRIATKYNTSSLLKILSNQTLINAIFALFPKDQIGDPREILIQAVKLRAMVRFFETLFRNLGSMHDKDMLTKGNKKHSIQSNEHLDFKENSIREAKKGNRSLSLSLNSDASKWAPSMLMSMMVYFVSMLDIPGEMKEMCISVLRAMNCKVLFLPESLQKKWARKDPTEIEADEDMEWLRNNCQGYYDTVTFFSGMGQGMLHYFANYMHLAKDDLLDEIFFMMKNKIPGLENVKVLFKTLISSDDLTKLIQLYFKQGKDSVEFMKFFIYLYDSTNKLSNIHTNWKKTGLQDLIREFNSLFGLGKRISLACLKDIYTAMEIVDLTEPEDAVKKLLSNLKRALSNGVYLTTLNNMSDLMRQWLLDVYKIQDGLYALCQMFKIDDYRDLPYNLGIMPRNEYLMECLLYGPEVLMYRSDNTVEINRFYRNLYTALEFEEEQVDVQVEDYNLPVSGKWRISLPTKTDKRIKQIRHDHEVEHSVDKEYLKGLRERFAFGLNYPKTEPSMFYEYCMDYYQGITRKYAFTDTASLHSLVRALGVCTGRCSLKPSIPMMEESTIVENYNQVDDIYSFARFIMTLDDRESLFDLTKQYSEIMKTSELVKAKLNHKVISESRRHPKMRTLRFYSQRISDMITTEEFIQTLFGTGGVVSNRYIRVLENVATCLNTNVQFLTQNPFKCIQNFFKYSTSPFNTFKMFLNYYLRSMRFVSIDMLSSFPDRGSTEQNLLFLYLDKLEPANVYTVHKADMLTSNKRLMCNQISMFKEIPDVKCPEREDMEKYMTEGILMTDGSLEKCYKALCYRTSMGENWPTQVVNGRVYYTRDFSRKGEFAYYTDFENLVVMEYGRKMQGFSRSYQNAEVYIYSCSEVSFRRSDIMKYVSKDIENLQSKGGLVNNKKYRDEVSIGKWFVTLVDWGRVMFKTNMSFGESFWYLSLHMDIGQYDVHCDFSLSSGEYLVYLQEDDIVGNTDLEDISILYSNALMLEDIYKILLKKGWLGTKKMIRKKAKNHEDPFEGMTVTQRKEMESNLSLKTEVTQACSGLAEMFSGGAVLGMDFNSMHLAHTISSMGTDENEPSTSGTINLGMKSDLDSLDQSTLMGLQSMFDQDRDWSNLANMKVVNPEERKTISDIIYRAILSACETELIVNYTAIVRTWEMLRGRDGNLDAKIWSGIATQLQEQLYNSLQISDDRFLRMILAVIASWFITRYGFPFPDEVYLYLNNPFTHQLVSIMTRSEEQSLVMSLQNIHGNE